MVSVLSSVPLRQLHSHLSAHWYSWTGKNKASANHLDHYQTLAAFQTSAWGLSQIAPPKGREVHTHLLCKDGKRKLQGGRESRAAGGEGGSHARGWGREAAGPCALQDQP